MISVIGLPFRHYIAGIFLAVISPYSLAEAGTFPTLNETFNLTGFILGAISFLVILSGIFLLCLKKLILDRNLTNENFKKLRAKHDELLDQKHQWLDKEIELINTNLDLDKRITARTETVNKINHELTKALEKTHDQALRLNSLATAIDNSQQKVLIINKHYHVCFASQAFLRFTGLSLINIQGQPLKLLEKHICLPEMASNGLTLNQNGLIDTQLKCLDNQGKTHWLNAQIALSWSDAKEIVHYVIIFDEHTENSQTEISHHSNN